ncbi:hypothetical protein ABT340_39690 [Streptosporangium sp. NPDC000239]|uniref:hypothetical protein n=1 Tax=Streptosporangium sp. NPDC000239 TaxID=3154248 RepID=UPI003321C922
MARLGRGQPIRSRVLRQPYRADAQADLGVLSLQTVFPALDVVTPDVNIPLGVLSLQTVFPALDMAIQQPATIPLGVLSLQVAFPTLDVEVPFVPGSLITMDGEIEWREALWSPLNQFRPQANLEGWDDLPGLSSGNAEKSQDHGSWPGADFSEERYVSATIQLRDDSPTWVDSLRAIRGLLTPGQDETEYPLVIRTRGETLLAWGKIKNRKIASDLIGVGSADIAVQWVCSDPRRYSLDEVGIHVATTGTATNTGDVPTRPRLRFFGPATVPRVHAAGRILAFNITLLAGEVFDVDCRTGDTIVGDVDYVPLYSFSVPIADFELPPGDTNITYAPDSGGAGGVDVFWRHSHL